MANLSKETPKEGLTKAAEIIAKHYPDETPAELLGRVQGLLAFIETLPKNLLSFSTQKHPLAAPQTGILHQFNNHNKSSSTKPEQANLKQDKVRETLLGQIEQIQAISHLEPAQKISAIKPR